MAALKFEACGRSKMAFKGILATFKCPIGSRVIYSDSTYENRSFGNKNNGLCRFGGNLWPKIGQNWPWNAGQRCFLHFFATKNVLKWYKYVCILFYSMSRLYWYQKYVSIPLWQDFMNFQSWLPSNLRSKKSSKFQKKNVLLKSS